MGGYKAWAADDILAAADLDSYLMDQAVTVWASSSARAAGILTPKAGMLSYQTDTNLYYRYNGSAWVELTVTNATNATNASKIGNITIFNSSSTPTANATGDLWFY